MADSGPEVMDEEAEAAYWKRRTPYRHEPGRKTRDVRAGDRWLPWHFTEEFEQRMRKEARRS